MVAYKCAAKWFGWWPWDYVGQPVHCSERRLPLGSKAYGLAKQLGKRVLKFFLAAHGHPSKLKFKFSG